MPISRALQDIVKETTKPTRTEFKELSKVPSEIKELPAEERLIKTDEFFQAPKTEEFIDVRREDIQRDIAYTASKQEKHQVKMAEQQEKIKEYERRVQEAPEILNARTHETLQRDLDALSTHQEKEQMLKERERDLYLKALSLKREKERTDEFKQYVQDGASPYRAVLDLISSSPGAGQKFSNPEGRATAIYNRISAEMFELKDALRTKVAGLAQDVDTAHEVVRYLKDGKIKNEQNLAKVKQIAEQWQTAAEKIKGLRNKAGARIGKLEDWVIPQSHDRQKMLKAGYKSWYENIVPKLDRERIEKEQGATLEDVLDSAWKNITTRQVEISGVKNGTSVARKGEFERVLHFKDGDSIIDYNKEFGNPDIFSTMDAHIMQQSKEIAAMQLFGPNPQATYNKLIELAKASDMGSTLEDTLNNTWKIVSGQADGDDIVDLLDKTLATGGQVHRNIQVSSKLGSAMISSLADLHTIWLGAGYRNFSSIKMIGKGIHTLLQEATSGGSAAENVALANRIGVVSEFASASMANSRFAETGAGMTQKVAEVVIRSSGMAAYTTAMRTSVGLEMAANFAENFSKNLEDTPFNKLFEEYGITPEDWNKIRQTQPKEVKKAKFLNVNKIYEVDENLGYKVNEMMTNEMDSFVIMPTARTRLWTTWGAKKGSLKGEVARNMMLFKSYPIAYTMMHMNRVRTIQGGAGKTAYIGKAIVASTVMGGITLLAYDIATGKTPRDVDRPAFLMEAIVKGGGLGIAQDFFIGATETKYGSSFSDIIMGVPASTIKDIVNTVQDFAVKDLDEGVAVGNVYKRAKNYIPGQNLWYTRAVVEASVGDYLGELIDPNHEQSIRKQKKAMRIRGQEYLLREN